MKSSYQSTPQNKFPRKRKPVHTSWVKKLSFALFETFHTLGSYFWRGIKKHPRMTGSLLTLSLLSYGTWQSFLGLQKFLQSYIPVTLEVYTTNFDIFHSVYKEGQKYLIKANEEQWTREKLQKAIITMLTQYEKIKVAHVRMGFDKKMRIYIEEEKPLLAVRTSDESIYIVGHKNQIIDKVSEQNLENLPLLYLPDTKILWKPALQRKPSDKISIPLLNWKWLYQNTSVVYQNFQNAFYKIKSLAWRENQGFVLTLEPTFLSNENPLPSSQPSSWNTTLVLLGNNELEKKLSRLSQILDDMKSKNTSAELIDLNFTDKAIFRLRVAETKQLAQTQGENKKNEKP